MNGCAFTNIMVKEPGIEDVEMAYERIFEDEKFFFEVILQGFTLKQKTLLNAIAHDPQLPLYSS